MKIILAAALAGFALASAVHAAPAAIERINPPGPDGKTALILKGAIVPAGYETFYLSGQVPDPIDPAKAASMEDFGDTKTQTLSTLKKIDALLASKGYTMGDVVKMQVFLVADPKTGKMDFAGFTEGFKQYFGSAAQPNTVARSTFQVASLVSPNYLVELEVTAVKAPRK